MEGMFVNQGNVLRPPFVVRHAIDRIYVNDVQVYPPAEVEGRQDQAQFGIRDVLGSTEKASTLDKLADVEKALEEFSSAKKSGWGDYRGASFGQKSEDIKGYMASKGFKTEVSSKYNHVLVPVNENFGVVALFNEETVIEETRRSLAEGKAETMLEYDATKLLSEYIESNLREGNYLRFDNNVIEAIPRKEMEAIGQEMEAAEEGSWSVLSDEQKVEKITESTSAAAAVIRRRCSAAIFFPHRSWQREAVGRASAYWSILANKLLAEGYLVRVYLDTSVTLNVWANILSTGAAQSLRVIYNEGHGDDNLIVVGEPQLKGNWLYFNSNFVNQYARLRNTVVYIHSCATMSDSRLAQAFVGKGACAYVGWRHPTSADPNFCDRVDSLFWNAMIDLNSTVIYAKNQIATIDGDVAGYGNPSCRLPPRGQC